MKHYRFVLPFCLTAFREWRNGLRVNARVSSALKRELARREAKSISLSASTEDWEMLSAKLLRFRPRLLGAVAAYTLLTGVSHRELRQQRGLDLFRMMWFLGSSQDDLIDELPPEMELPDQEIRKIVRASIFGANRTFYRAAFTVFADELKQSGFSEEAKTYLRRKTRAWYSFLVRQEARVLSTKTREFTFAYCRTYREDQNRTIGEVLTACLNGWKCIDPAMQRFERIIPLLSFRTQIVDDIADIPEDLHMGRPSYCVGALTDHPDELSRVREYLSTHQHVKKMHPRTLKGLAPLSYSLIERTYKQYGYELRQRGASSDFLGSVGDILFHWFPRFRDTIHKVNPNASNF